MSQNEFDSWLNERLYTLRLSSMPSVTIIGQCIALILFVSTKGLRFWLQLPNSHFFVCKNAVATYDFVQILRQCEFQTYYLEFWGWPLGCDG